MASGDARDEGSFEGPAEGLDLQVQLTGGSPCSRAIKAPIDPCSAVGVLMPAR